MELLKAEAYTILVRLILTGDGSGTPVSPAKSPLWYAFPRNVNACVSSLLQFVRCGDVPLHWAASLHTSYTRRFCQSYNVLRTPRIVLVSLPSQQQSYSRLQLELYVDHRCLTRSTITTSAFMDALGFRLVAGQDTVDLLQACRTTKLIVFNQTKTLTNPSTSKQRWLGYTTGTPLVLRVFSYYIACFEHVFLLVHPWAYVYLPTLRTGTVLATAVVHTPRTSPVCAVTFCGSK